MEDFNKMMKIMEIEKLTRIYKRIVLGSLLGIVCLLLLTVEIHFSMYDPLLETQKTLSLRIVFLLAGLILVFNGIFAIFLHFYSINLNKNQNKSIELKETKS